MNTHDAYEAFQAALDDANEAEAVNDDAARRKALGEAKAFALLLVARPQFASQVALAVAVLRHELGEGSDDDAAIWGGVEASMLADDDIGDSPLWAISEDMFGAALNYASDKGFFVVNAGEDHATKWREAFAARDRELGFDD